ncbi:MAG: hypothetical protein LAQ69_40870 [Acidobacteriia bacterium]|nr:hypothetical protein [Terriglobia bacterium]
MIHRQQAALGGDEPVTALEARALRTDIGTYLRGLLCVVDCHAGRPRGREFVPEGSKFKVAWQCGRRAGGYLGRMGDMWELERRWTNELSAHPKIDFFKASQCKVDDAPPFLSGQFRGWPPEIAEEKRKRLARIIYDMSPRLVAIRSVVR